MPALLTDLYELNMAASYLRRKVQGPATFSLFARRLPPERGFLVCAGVESSLEFLEGFRFDAEELRYLRDGLPFSPADVDAVSRLRFTGDMWAVPEGRIVLAGEPLLEVTAPIAEAQLVETVLLNRVTFETSIASKAARCVVAAQGRDLIDFAFRRTLGFDAALDVARLSALVGFVATSNVEGARRHGLVAAGTMAHSYIEAFPGEEAAFQAFAEDFPDRLTFLVDTYDTLVGLEHAISVIRRLGLAESAGGRRLAIRLDSGDLADLSSRCRARLDAAGLPEVRILASGSLDEFEIDDLVRGGAPIDAFGVGTKMGVSADSPYLDTAYKLVEVAGRPVMKLSSGKMTAPGRKQVFRRPSPFQDLVGLREEQAPPEFEPVLEPVMVSGRRTVPPAGIPDARSRFRDDLARLPEAARRVRSPAAPDAGWTPALERLAAATEAELRSRLGSGSHASSGSGPARHPA